MCKNESSSIFSVSVVNLIVGSIECMCVRNSLKKKEMLTFIVKQGLVVNLLQKSTFLFLTDLDQSMEMHTSL